MGREMRQLQIHGFRGIMRQNDILRLRGDEISHVVVSILDFMIVADQTMKIVTRLPLQQCALGEQ